MTERRCKTCTHFVQWPRVANDGYSAEGVCTAPRPDCTSRLANREMRLYDGKNCMMWEAKNETT